MEPAPKRSKKMEPEAEIEPKQQLPDDVVLEIVARCGTISDVVRCTAISKPLRRGILQAPFLRHLRDGREHSDGRPFIPKLLLGLYYQSCDPHLQPSFVPASSDGARWPFSVAALPPAPNHRGDDAGDSSPCDFGPYRPAYSRRSLLVLRRRCKNSATEHLMERHGLHPVELSVCNPTTGERRVLPPHDVNDMSHALLDVDPIAPSSFKLLVVEILTDGPRTLCVQTFSSEEAAWGPVLACPIKSTRTNLAERWVEFDYKAGRPRAVVVGDAIHWLCISGHGDCILTLGLRGGGAAHEAKTASLPPGYRYGHTYKRQEKCLAVLPSQGDAAGAGSRALLSLIGIQNGEIEVWAREESSRKWDSWHRIQGEVIPRPRGVSSRWLRGADLSWSWFCEGSGTLFMRAGDSTMSPLLLDLDTMEVRKLDTKEWELSPEPDFCPYEIDLLSYMLYVMKQF